MNNSILIIGDVMLDRFIYGECDRISPEAPVPVIRFQNEEHQLGGASHVAFFIQNLNRSVHLVSCIGDDREGKRLEEELQKYQIPSTLFVDCQRQTTVKNRIMTGGQQVVRYDCEDTFDISSDLEETVCQKLKKSIHQSRLVVVSDYNKGVVTDKIMRCLVSLKEQYDFLLIVDPKPSSSQMKYEGCDIMTPNHKEASLLLGEEVTLENYPLFLSLLKKRYHLLYPLVTMAEEGIIYDDGKNSSHCRSHAEEVYDVSGAGDAVIATLAVCLDQGMDLKESVYYANKSASFVVNKVGVAVVSFNILFGGSSKIYSDVHLLNSEIKGQRVVFTNGCFDILHRGHISCLREAKKQGDILVVAVNSDASVRRLKGDSRPFHTLEDRLFVLSELSCVDYLISFDEDTPYKLLQQMLCHVLVKGGDYCREDVVGHDLVDEVVIVPFDEGYSSTRIINLLE